MEPESPFQAKGKWTVALAKLLQATLVDDDHFFDMLFGFADARTPFLL